MSISIIIPVKDSVSNVNSTLASILADENLVDRNIEIIICNDGDSTEVNECAESWKSRGYNILTERISPNKGSYNARNRGIDKAKGKYLIFFDIPISIDQGWFLPFIKLLKKNDYVAGDIKIKPEDCRTIAEKMYAATAFPVSSYFHDQHFGPTAFLGVKKEVFEQVGLFKQLQSGGDMEFGQRVYQAGLKMVYFNEFPAWHPPRNLKQQFWKKVRVYKGIKALNKLHENGSSTFQSILSLWNCITAIPANLIKFRKNIIYRSGLFSYPEYVVAVFQFWGVEFSSRLYLLLNRSNK